MLVDPSVIVEQLRSTYGRLTQSVNQVLQAGRGDPHRIHLQSNDVAHFENTYRFVSPSPPLMY